MIRTILVPLDGSTFGEQALPLALSIARRAQARLELIHVHTPVQEYSELLLFDAPLDAKIRKQEKMYLEDVVRRLNAATNVKVSVVNKDGHVPDIVKEHAAAIQADLVVMTTHARGPMGRFWLGSVADRLVRELTIPLLLVHPQEQPLPDLKADVAFRNITVPMDGSPLSEGILENAAFLARTMDAGITLIRVIKPLFPMTMPMGVGTFGEMANNLAVEVETIQANLRKEAADYLQKVAQRLTAQKIPVSTRVEVEDQPARAILNVKGADLIAMETHGRRGLARFFLGSVADKVLRGSNVPLLVCHPRTAK